METWNLSSRCNLWRWLHTCGGTTPLLPTSSRRPSLGEGRALFRWEPQLDILPRCLSPFPQASSLRATLTHNGKQFSHVKQPPFMHVSCSLSHLLTQLLCAAYMCLHLEHLSLWGTKLHVSTTKPVLLLFHAATAPQLSQKLEIKPQAAHFWNTGQGGRRDNVRCVLMTVSQGT